VRIAELVGDGEVAGGQLVALAIARAARDAGHDVRFVAPAAGAFTELAGADGFAVHVVPLGGALDVRALLRLRALLRAERIDVLHTHTHFSLNVLGRLAARLARVRVVAHMHIANVFRPGPGRSLQVALDNVTARLCAAIVAVSDATCRTLLAQGYPRRVQVVHNGVERPTAAPRRPEGVPDGAPLVLLVGRLAPVKGQAELIDALARLESRDAVVLLAGKDLEQGGAYGDELLARAEAAGVADRVAFLGYREDAPSILAAADVLVLPSRDEGLPLVVLEAMATGRPVVATSVGGTPELIVDGETGLLVPSGDVAALAVALDAVLRDSERAAALGEAGRRRFEERFTLDAMTRQVLEVYDDVACGSRS
jgi:glycosyltransferase involved in cell wall biosynthesis